MSSPCETRELLELNTGIRTADKKVDNDASMEDEDSSYLNGLTKNPLLM
jgi:hypothetical protein